MNHENLSLKSLTINKRSNRRRRSNSEEHRGKTKPIGVAGGYRVALWDPHRVACDRGPGEAVPRTDQQYSAKAVQLQRDPQSPSGVGYHLRAVHAGATGDTSSCRRDAGVLA